MTRSGTYANTPRPDREAPGRRMPGRLAGKLWIADDFDETPEDILAAFEGDLDVRSDTDSGS